MCEEYHYHKDYKLKLIAGFYRDHMVKHIKNYSACYNSDAFHALPTNADKDRAFLDCHNRWTRNLKEEVALELDIKARQLFF